MGRSVGTIPGLRSSDEALAYPRCNSIHQVELIVAAVSREDRPVECRCRVSDEDSSRPAGTVETAIAKVKTDGASLDATSCADLQGAPDSQPTGDRFLKLHKQAGLELSFNHAL